MCTIIHVSNLLEIGTPKIVFLYKRFCAILFKIAYLTKVSLTFVPNFLVKKYCHFE